jgi:hypothetical protein
MKDPRRLLEHGASEGELALLRAGAAEEPSISARQRLLASVGVSAALASAALAPSAAAQAGAHAGAGSGVLKLAAAKLGVKGLVLALGSASAIGGAWVAVQLAARPDAPRVPVHEAAPAKSQPARPIDAADSSLAAEIAQVDRARSLLQAGDAHAAARVLDRYVAQRPAGALRQEAEVLRIEAHWQLGELDQARRLSHAFLRAYAASPHAERVRARLTPSAGRAR